LPLGGIKQYTFVSSGKFEFLDDINQVLVDEDDEVSALVARFAANRSAMDLSIALRGHPRVIAP